MVVVTDSPNFNQRTRVKHTSIVLFFTVHITIITRPIHLINGSLKNNCPLATVEAVSRCGPPMGFPTSHSIHKPYVAICFALLSGSSVVIKEVCIGTVKPNIAGFDQLETTFELGFVRGRSASSDVSSDTSPSPLTAGTRWCFPGRNLFLDMFCNHQTVFLMET